MYDSLAKVYGFYATLSKDPNLTEFGFVLTWPKLKPEEKRDAVLEARLPRVELLPVEEGPAVLRRGRCSRTWRTRRTRRSSTTACSATT